MKALGVKLRPGCFGTCYASLSYLHHTPFDAIEIGRSFIAKLDPRESAPG